MSIPESKNKKPDRVPRPTASTVGSVNEAFEEISLAVESYGDVPIVAASQQERQYPEIYESDGAPMPFGAPLDYDS